MPAVNVLVGGDFEGVADYYLTGGASVEDGVGADGSRACALLAMNQEVLGRPVNLLSGVVWEAYPQAAGYEHDCTFLVNMVYGRPGSQLIVSVDRGLGVWDHTYTHTLPADPQDQFVLVTVPSWVAQGAVGALRIETDQEPWTMSTYWLVDNVQLGPLQEDVMGRGTLDARHALLDALSSINGAAGGYWHDMSERVFQVLTPPELDPGLLREGPYLAFPADMTEVQDDSTDHSGVITDMTFMVFGFVVETDPRPRGASAPEACAKLVDDIKRAFAEAPDLERQVLKISLSFEVVGSGGPPPRYGEVACTVKVRQIADKSELGSAS